HRDKQRDILEVVLHTTQQLHELVQHADAWTASVHKRCNALTDTNRIGIGKAQRAIGMHVDIDPSGTKIMTGHIDDFRILAKLARPDKLNLAISDMDIHDPVDPLSGVNDMRPFQDKRIGRDIHASAPCDWEIYSIKLE